DAALHQAKLLTGRDNNDPDPPPNGTATMADVIIKDLAQGGKGEIDLDTVDKVGASLGGRDRFMFHYVLAQYLNLHGQKEAAQRYAKRCMAWPKIGVRYRTLAGAMLVGQGVQPEEYK